jgi:hypothetical protein
MLIACRPHKLMCSPCLCVISRNHHVHHYGLLEGVYSIFLSGTNVMR